MSENSRPLSGFFRMVAATAIVLIAVLAMLLVFDVIPMSTFGELAGRIVLAGCVFGLAAVGLALVGGARR